MSRVAIIAPGVQTLVQDLGRPGHGALGVPRGGAADALSLSCGNALLGNPPAAPAIEMAMLGAELKFSAAARCCLAGAPSHAMLVDGAGTSRSVPPWTALDVRPGERLVVKAIRPGLRAYLCIAGGVMVPACLGSASTLLSCSLGGFRGRALRAGDELDIGPAWTSNMAPVASMALVEWLEATLRPGTLRVVATPDGHGACRDALDALLASPLTVSRHSDRVGVRLVPTPTVVSAIRNAASGRVPSMGMAHGAIELTPGGEPIILGVDHPTTGGYPVVACVIAADLAALGQLAPGDVVRLARVDRDEARRAWAAGRSMLALEVGLS
jgi:biotin-dependent carboxylase-like uncharacterized protein